MEGQSIVISISAQWAPFKGKYGHHYRGTQGKSDWLHELEHILLY
jgi:hypothetical protein